MLDFRHAVTYKNLPKCILLRTIQEACGKAGRNMKITAQVEFGFRCLLRMARAAHAVTIAEIALAEGLSIPYVAKFLGLLRRAGLIESVRGRSGGYRLCRPAEAITLRAILTVLNGPLFEDEEFCRRHAGTETNGACVHHDACSLRALWMALDAWTSMAFEGITLADFLNSEGRTAALLHSRLASIALEQAAWPGGTEVPAADPAQLTVLPLAHLVSDPALCSAER
jgi:Rrf2 family protein